MTPEDHFKWICGSLGWRGLTEKPQKERDKGGVEVNNLEGERSPTPQFLATPLLATHRVVQRAHTMSVTSSTNRKQPDTAGRACAVRSTRARVTPRLSDLW